MKNKDKKNTVKNVPQGRVLTDHIKSVMFRCYCNKFEPNSYTGKCKHCGQSKVSAIGE